MFLVQRNFPILRSLINNHKPLLVVQLKTVFFIVPRCYIWLESVSLNELEFMKKSNKVSGLTTASSI